ncbi:hypothetical protein BDY21DRAFT_157340 [Lineolata rhizophorae]|uniref:Uncharacterized protein n=1 Tax=Lineolata rhizophorae TaxID=578093 RepID=A0A6A6NLD3_9PEZI|nr:hypothetical protein BDY21DRAFT_157340 [Lineolata rhizophorae]
MCRRVWAREPESARLDAQQCRNLHRCCRVASGASVPWIMRARLPGWLGTMADGSAQESDELLIASQARFHGRPKHAFGLFANRVAHRGASCPRGDRFLPPACDPCASGRSKRGSREQERVGTSSPLRRNTMCTSLRVQSSASVKFAGKAWPANSHDVNPQKN